MFERISLIIVLTISGLMSGCGQDTGTGDTMLVVDLAAVARAMGKDDEMSAMLDQARQVLNEQLIQIGGDLEQQVQDKKTELEKSAKGKTGDDQQQELVEFTRKANLQLQQTREVARQKAVTFRDKLVQEFRKEVMDVAIDIARDKGAVSVSIAGNHLLWHDSSIDITDEVIGTLRAAMPKQNREATTEAEVEAGQE